MVTDDEYEGTFDCSICKLEKPYHEDIFEINEIMVCDDCNVEDTFQENCYDCMRELSGIEIEFLIHKFNKVIKCVQCLSNDNDKKLELSFYNYKYLNKKVIPNEDEKYIYMFKYKELTRNVNKILEISDSKNIDDAINTFSQIKKENTEFIQIIQDNPELECPKDISIIIEERNKYKKKVKNFVQKLKENNIYEEDKFIDFLENYKNNYNNIITNIKDKSIRLQDNPIFKYDLLDIDYKHFKNKLDLYKLFKNFEKKKNNTKNIKINKSNILNLKSSAKELTDKYVMINKELNELENLYEQMVKVEPIFNKLKSNIYIIDNNINEDNELMKLFSKLNNDKINEYKTMKEIGKQIIENNIDDNQLKNKLNTYNDRNDRIILKSKRIYLLSKHIDIETIALSRISHFIRDSHINTFNCLLNVLKINPVSINSLFI